MFGPLEIVITGWLILLAIVILYRMFGPPARRYNASISRFDEALELQKQQMAAANRTNELLAEIKTLLEQKRS
jgi:hypothetical protein